MFFPWCTEQLRFSASRFSYWFCCDLDVPCDCRQGSPAYCQVVVNNVAQDQLSRSTSLNRWLAQIIPR